MQYDLTLVDHSGGNSIKLPRFFCLKVGSIFEYCHDNYLIVKIDHDTKEIIATEIKLIEKQKL